MAPVIIRITRITTTTIIVTQPANRIIVVWKMGWKVFIPNKSIIIRSCPLDKAFLNNLLLV